MKELILLNSSDGYIVEEVDARKCDYDAKCFIYRDRNDYYKKWYLVDRETGIYVCFALTQKKLKEWYLEHLEKINDYRKTPKYQIKVERFKKAKLAYNYERR